MTLRSRQSLFAFNIHLLIEFAYKNGFELTFGEFDRTIEQQKIYFTTGRSKTMDSRHLHRLAGDFNIFVEGKLTNDPKVIKPMGDFWESLHTDNRWGGDWDRDDNLDEEKFKDPYHFEMKPF